MSVNRTIFCDPMPIVLYGCDHSGKSDLRNLLATLWEELRDVVMPHSEGVGVKMPLKSGSRYFIYKKYFFIVLLRLVDAHLCVTFIDVGAYSS